MLTRSLQRGVRVLTTLAPVHSVVGGSRVAAVANLRCALLCRSLVNACRELKVLYINTDIGTSRTVLRGILAAQLGPNRTIQLVLPGK